MNIENKNRWYDGHPDFSNLLKELKDLQKEDREKIITGMKDIIMDFDNELIDRHVLDFPLTFKRRWYDKDPYSWLVVNALKYAEVELIQNMIIYLSNELK